MSSSLSAGLLDVLLLGLSQHKVEAVCGALARCVMEMMKGDVGGEAMGKLLANTGERGEVREGVVVVVGMWETESCNAGGLAVL